MAGMHGWSKRAKPPRPGWESGCWEGSWRLITGRETPASRSFSIVVLMNQCLRLTRSSTTRFSSAGLGELDEAPVLAASSGDEHIPPSAFIHRPEFFAELVRPSTTPGLCMSLKKRPIRISTCINKQFCRRQQPVLPDEALWLFHGCDINRLAERARALHIGA